MESLTLAVIAKALIFPLKVIAFVFLIVFSRLFYNNEDIKTKKNITTALVLTRFTMSMFVLIVSFHIVRHFFVLNENTIFFMSGALSFGYREVMDTFLKLVKNPFKIKELFKTNSTVDPSGDDYPEDEEI